jgi:hypothetical protein
MTPDVVAVKDLANYELLVTFAGGEKRRFSMCPYLHYSGYQLLRQPGKFQLAHVSNGTVAWSEDVDISPDTLYIKGEPVL